ncbi:MAG TPA: c-type cytochrome biogenesis protein CcmI, partial [Thiotrichales bacterium]|nr:c-type cytochrome biogenesis protein CcmI [Thiotrichales bacterium]
MNVVFWSLLLAMLLLAIAMLVIPLLRVRDSRRIAYTESNLKIYDDKVRELAQDLEEGRIDLAHYKYACNELDRELLADVPEESMDTAAQHYARTAKRQPAVALLIAVFVPLVAFLLYLQLGMHAAGTEELQAQMAEQSAPGEMSIPQMTKKLEQRIQQQGGSVTDWAML